MGTKAKMQVGIQRAFSLQNATNISRCRGNGHSILPSSTTFAKVFGGAREGQAHVDEKKKYDCDGNPSCEVFPAGSSLIRNA